MEVEVPGLTPPVPGLAGLMGYGYGDTGAQILWPSSVSMPKEMRDLEGPPRHDQEMGIIGDEEMGNDHG